jgi:hypothetical protein
VKFAVCTECLDWVKLRYEDRTCACGKSGGHYLADGLHAVIWGSCFAVGADNFTFGRAVGNRTNKVVLKSNELRRHVLRGEWWIIEAGVAGSHVKHFRTRKAALRGRLRCIETSAVRQEETMPLRIKSFDGGNIEPCLRMLHPTSSLSPSKLSAIRRRSTTEIIASLAPGKAEALKTHLDGTVVDGHHRLTVLCERGFNINTLPREIVPR